MPARVLGVGVRATAANIWTAIQTFGSGLLKLRNPANTFDYIFKGGAIVADRDVTMPLLTGADILVTEAMVQPLSGKRVTLRAPTVTQSATPAINTDVTDVAHITGLAQAITSMTTSLTGTPSQGDKLHIDITDDGTARAITWGASFESSAIALPTTTILNARLDIDLVWNTVTSKWRCVAATVAPAVADLTGTTLPAGITTSSLTSVGTLASPNLTTPTVVGANGLLSHVSTTNLVAAPRRVATNDANRGPFINELIVGKTAIGDNTLANVITVTVPNPANHLGAIILLDWITFTDANRTGESGQVRIDITRRASAATAKAIAVTLAGVEQQSGAFAEVLTVTWTTDALVGADNATQTFNIEVTVDSDVGGIPSIYAFARVLSAGFLGTPPCEVTMAVAA